MQKESSSEAPEDHQNEHLPIIYIVGNSHSGSTLLSFLLAFSPDIVNLGELKSKTWLKDRFCSCGQPVDTCSFYKNYFGEFNTLKQAAMHHIRKTNPVLFLFRKKIKPGPSAIGGLLKFYSSLSRHVRVTSPHASFIVDNSKSIWLLNAWIHTLPRKQIRIIRIRRDLRANVASFVKRGSPFFTSLISILINNRITDHFLRDNKLEFVEVNYDRFYTGYADEAKLISAFLGIQLPVENEGDNNHHVISGNAKTRQSFTKGFAGVHKDDEWERVLSGRQKKILSWIS
jgi:hypothetical protein